MRVLIEINISELELKKAIAKGWNNRYGEELTYKDIKTTENKEDIVSAIPYLDLDSITLKPSTGRGL